MADNVPELSVVIPALNEAAALPALLQDLQAQQGLQLEVLVADGGSQDDTAKLATAAGARVVPSPSGRGRQMNAGAAAAYSDWLLFLHADSRIDNPQQLRDALDVMRASDKNTAGHFPLSFKREKPGHNFLFRFAEAKTRSNRPGTINGDQGLLLHRDFLRELGGFDESLPILEDQRIAARIFDQGQWALLPGTLHTSARRLEKEGHWARYTLMSLMMGLHAAGVEAFFRRAPQIYAEQSRTGRLPVHRFLLLTWKLLIEAGAIGACRILLDAGRFTRKNSWQLFLYADLLRGKNTQDTWTAWHDRHFLRWTDNRFCDGVTAVLISIWFLLILPPLWWLAELLARGRTSD